LIGELLLDAAGRWPSAAALVDDATGRHWTFADFARACAGFGATLAEAGARPGAHIAILADAQPEYLFADYGAMAAGYVRVPLDPALSVEELRRQVEDAEARVLVAGASRFAQAQEVCAGSAVQVLRLEERRAEANWPRPQASSLATLNYTGGTSSEPKAVMHTHASLSRVLGNIAAARGTAPGEVMLNVRPLWPIAAVIVAAHLTAGGTVVLGGGFDAERFVAQLRRYRAASTSLVPTHIVRLLRWANEGKLAGLDALRAIDVGAAAIPQETFAEAVEALGPRIGVLYGLTEAPWSCYQPPTELVGADGGVRAERLRTAGRPVPGCEVRIEGASGEVLIRGPHIMRGYWKREALSQEVLREGWFHTGDQGEIEDGILRIVGRIKETIRSGGKSVLPDEVERALCSHAGVAEAAVVGLPDAEWGEIVAAAVVAAPGAALTPQLLLEHCQRQLSPHKRPKLIRLVDSLPRSHYGKVQRAKVKAALTGA
jgi:acyl-CoA synthetase (AMP-forming)/AMP-acid ligase II